MKALIAAASAAALLAALPAIAQAQDATGQSGLYGNLGYSNLNDDNVNLGAIQGRLGYRFGQHLGVEGELAGGVKGDAVNVAGTNVNVDLQHQAAIYGVGFLPLTPNIDLLGRVGYGSTKIKGSALGQSASDDGDSWNFGVGGQYRFDDANGVRLDYTRQEFRGSDAGSANVWSLGYVRRF
ncbi:MAG: porin family protein [Phenylobacterium sp.]